MYLYFIYCRSKTIWHIYEQYIANQNRRKNNKFLILNEIELELNIE